SIIQLQVSKFDAALAVGADELKNPDPKIRSRAVGMFNMVGKLAQPFEPKLRAVLDDSDLGVALFAATVLTRLEGVPADAFLPVLRRGVGARDGTHQESGVHVCVALGARAKPLVPELLELARRRTDMVAVVAAQALLKADRAAAAQIAEPLSALLLGDRRNNRHQSYLIQQVLRD